MRRLIFALLVLFLIATGGALAWYASGNEAIAEARARTIVSHCADAEYRPSCYEERVPALLNAGVPYEDTFEVAYEIQKLDTSGEYCHNIAHRLGATEVAKDPALWKDVIRRTPHGKCLNGGIHGAFQERFRASELASAHIPSFVNEMQDLCTVRTDLPSSPGDIASCVHGIGHLFMFVTDGNVQDSISMCQAMSFDEDVGVTEIGQEISCHEGIFMQLFEPHEPEDHALIVGQEQSKETVGAFCTSFDGLPLTACLARSAAFFYENPGAGAPNAPDCSILETERLQRACQGTQVRIFARDTFFDLTAAREYCGTLPKSKVGWCYAMSGSYAFTLGYFDSEQPFLFCKQAELQGSGASCYDELSKIIAYTFAKNDLATDALCSRLPAPYDDLCREVSAERNNE